MSLPQRKVIRLREYDYRTPGFYFVTVCTHEKQRLFEPFVGASLCTNPQNVGADLCVRPPDKQNFIGWWLLELQQKYESVRIDTACIMPDHIHVLIELTGGHIGPPLQEIVQWYKTQTTNEYIRRVKRGELLPFHQKVWQRGLYEHIIRNDAELNETRQYILTNPLAATL